jgi:hypothetical protein
MNQHFSWRRQGELRTLITAANCGPIISAFATKACAVPQARAVCAGPLIARYLLVRARQCAMARWEECCSGTRVLTQVKATNRISSRQLPQGGQSNHALHRLTERVGRLYNRLAAPFVVAPDGAYICDLYDDAIERVCVIRRVWVLVGGQLEAASACVAGTEARRGTEGKLAHPGCEAGGGHATRYGGTVLSVRARVECDSRCLPGWPQPE